LAQRVLKPSLAASCIGAASLTVKQLV
ncbi:uncharacterized protein METZ01_LOCUS316228, partial [marine metagenome]